MSKGNRDKPLPYIKEPTTHAVINPSGVIKWNQGTCTADNTVIPTMKEHPLKIDIFFRRQ